MGVVRKARRYPRSLHPRHAPKKIDPVHIPAKFVPVWGGNLARWSEFFGEKKPVNLFVRTYFVSPTTYYRTTAGSLQFLPRWTTV